MPTSRPTTLLALSCLAATWASLAARAASPGPSPIPEGQIPPAVLAQLKGLENQFDLALAQDCAPERCFSKGCVYGAHVVADKPRSGSLPGLGDERGPGSVASQEYLTQATCEFAHEKSIPVKDVQALIKRLQQKLSKGWMVVTVENKLLEPISAGLRDSPPPPPEPVVAPPPAKAETPPAPSPTWELGVAMRELWVSLLPHFSWMIAVVLGTLATLIIIWGLRRLGRESLEDKALLAQLAQGGPPADEGQSAAEKREEGAPLDPPAKEKSLSELGDEKEDVAAQMSAWNERIAGERLEKEQSVVNDLLREWLKSGEFALLAKAIFVFNDRLPLAFPSDGELAKRKIEFADYIRTVDEQRLPSDAEFFRTLNQHAISSSLLSQSDAEVYRSLREEFGSMGVARLIEMLPGRQGALLFALVPVDCQQEVARVLTLELRRNVCEQLLVSNRVSREETAHVFAVLRAACAGKAIPQHDLAETILDRGCEFDAAGALSVLLPYVPEKVRQELFSEAFERSSGAFPLWYEKIVFADMLTRVPGSLQTDLLLDVDIRSLAGWLSMQNPAWLDRFMRGLSPSMLNAVRASMAFGSRADQLTLARRGQGELAAALQKLVARGQVTFAEILT
jgi:hypothetical protein